MSSKPTILAPALVEQVINMLTIGATKRAIAKTTVLTIYMVNRIANETETQLRVQAKREAISEIMGMGL
jgi:hypothetical protein